MNLTTRARKLVDAARIAAELAQQLNDLADTPPRQAPVSSLRPVETTVIGLEQHGVLDLVTKAETDLLHATLRTAHAARALENARDAFGGDSA